MPPRTGRNGAAKPTMTPNRSEKEKMLAGELYTAADPELVAERIEARRLMRLFNATREDEPDRRTELLGQLFGQVGPTVEVEPPFYCDYGKYIFAGDRLYANYGCVILDVNEVHIGAGAYLAPYVQIYTAHHPVDPATRRSGVELATPVRIGENCWLGGGVIVCPGVTIGNNVTVGAGSVVTKDLPDNVLAAGNPCRVLREV